MADPLKPPEFAEHREDTNIPAEQSNVNISREDIATTSGLGEHMEVDLPQEDVKHDLDASRSDETVLDSGNEAGNIDTKLPAAASESTLSAEQPMDTANSNDGTAEATTPVKTENNDDPMDNEFASDEVIDEMGLDPEPISKREVAPKPETAPQPEPQLTTVAFDDEFASSEVIPPELLSPQPGPSAPLSSIPSTSTAPRQRSSSSPKPCTSEATTTEKPSRRRQSKPKTTSERSKSSEDCARVRPFLPLPSTCARVRPFIRRVVPLRGEETHKYGFVDPSMPRRRIVQESQSGAGSSQSEAILNSATTNATRSAPPRPLDPAMLAIFDQIKQQVAQGNGPFSGTPPLADPPVPRPSVPHIAAIVNTAAKSIIPVVNPRPPLIGGPARQILTPQPGPAGAPIWSASPTPSAVPPISTGVATTSRQAGPLVVPGGSVASTSAAVPTSSDAVTVKPESRTHSETPQPSGSGRPQTAENGAELENRVRDAPSEPRRFARQKDAIEYLDEVKKRFPADIYANFLDVMKLFKLQNIDTINVIRRVCYLFSADMNLIVGFNNFLPQGFNITVAEQSVVAIRNPNGFCYTVDVRLPPDSQCCVAFSPEPRSILSGETQGTNNGEMTVTGVLQAAYPDEHEAALTLERFGSSVQPPEAIEVDRPSRSRTRSHGSFPRTNEGQTVYSALTYLRVLKQRLSRAQYKKFKKIIERCNLLEMSAPLAKELFRELKELLNLNVDLLTGITCFVPELRPWCENGIMVKGKPVPSKAREVQQYVKLEQMDGPNEAGVVRKRPVNALMREMPRADMVEFAFFTKVREAIGNDHVFENFSRIMRLYNRNLITKSEMLTILNTFFRGLPLLLREFKRIMNIDQEVLLARAPSPIPAPDDPYWDGTRTLHAEIAKREMGKPLNYAMIKHCGRSYRILPEKYRHRKCSGRTPEMAAVLNDSWIIIPKWQSEETTRASFKKSSLEEFLHRVEDERFEIDILRQVNRAAMTALEKMQMYVEQDPNYRPNERYECDSKVLMLRAIRRAYGENGPRVMDGLRINPSIIAPTVMNRLRLKEREWQNLNSAFELIWSDQAKKYWVKTQQTKEHKMKLAENRGLRGTAMLLVLEKLFMKRSGYKDVPLSKGPFRLPVKPTNKSFNYNPPPTEETIAILEERKTRRWNPEPDSDDDTADMDDCPTCFPRGKCASTAVTLDFNVRWNRVYDLNQLLLRCLNRIRENSPEDKEELDIVEHFIREILPAVFDIQPMRANQPNPRRNTANKAAGPAFQPRLFFADDVCIHVINMYHCCAMRLHKLAERAKILSQTERFENELVQMRIRAWREAGEEPPPWSDGAWDRPTGWELMMPKKARVFDRYATYLSDLQAVIDGNMTVKHFEEHAKSMYLGETFPIGGIDKYLITIVKQIQQIVTTPHMKHIVDRFWTDSIQTTPAKYDKFIQDGIATMDSLMADENHYLIEVFDARTTFVALRLIKYQVTTESRKNRFRAAHWKTWRAFYRNEDEVVKSKSKVPIVPFVLIRNIREGWLRMGRFPIHGNYDTEPVSISADEEEEPADSGKRPEKVEPMEVSPPQNADVSMEEVSGGERSDHSEDDPMDASSSGGGAAPSKRVQRVDEDAAFYEEELGDYDRDKLLDDMNNDAPSDADDTKDDDEVEESESEDIEPEDDDEDAESDISDDFTHPMDTYQSGEDSDYAGEDDDDNEGSMDFADRRLHMPGEVIDPFNMNKKAKKHDSGDEERESDHSDEPMDTQISLPPVDPEEREQLEEVEEELLSTGTIEEAEEEEVSTDYDGDGLERFATYDRCSSPEELFEHTKEDEEANEFETAKALVSLATKVLHCTKDPTPEPFASSSSSSSSEEDYGYDARSKADKAPKEKKNKTRKQRNVQHLPPPAASTSMPEPPTLIELAPSSSVQVTIPRREPSLVSTALAESLYGRKRGPRGRKPVEVPKSKKVKRKPGPPPADKSPKPEPTVASSPVKPEPVAVAEPPVVQTPEEPPKPAPKKPLKPVATRRKSLASPPPVTPKPTPVTTRRTSRGKSASRQPTAPPVQPVPSASAPATRKRRLSSANAEPSSPTAKPVAPVPSSSPPVKVKPSKSPPKTPEKPKPKRRIPSPVSSSSEETEDSASGETRIIAIEDLPEDHPVIRDLISENECKRRMNKFNANETYRTMKQEIRTLIRGDIVSDTDHDYDDERIVKDGEKHMGMTLSDRWWWTHRLKLKPKKVPKPPKKYNDDSGSDDESSDYGPTKRRSSTTGRPRRGGRRGPSKGRGGRPRKVAFDPDVPGPSTAPHEEVEEEASDSPSPPRPPLKKKSISVDSDIHSVTSEGLTAFPVQVSLSPQVEKASEEEEATSDEEPTTSGTMMGQMDERRQRSETLASSRSSGSPYPGPSVSASNALAELMIEARPTQSQTPETEPREVCLPSAPRMYDDDLPEEPRGGSTRCSSPDLGLEGLQILSDGDEYVISDEDEIEFARGDRSSRSRSRSRSPINVAPVDDFDEEPLDRSPPRRIMTRSRSRSMQATSIVPDEAEPIEPMDTLAEVVDPDDRVDSPVEQFEAIVDEDEQLQDNSIADEVEEPMEAVPSEAKETEMGEANADANDTEDIVTDADEVTEPTAMDTASSSENGEMQVDEAEVEPEPIEADSPTPEDADLEEDMEPAVEKVIDEIENDYVEVSRPKKAIFWMSDELAELCEAHKCDNMTVYLNKTAPNIMYRLGAHRMTKLRDYSRLIKAERFEEWLDHHRSGTRTRQHRQAAVFEHTPDSRAFRVPHIPTTEETAEDAIVVEKELKTDIERRDHAIVAAEKKLRKQTEKVSRAVALYRAQQAPKQSGRGRRGSKKTSDVPQSVEPQKKSTSEHEKSTSRSRNVK